MTEKWYYKGIECSAHSYPESGVVFVSGFNHDLFFSTLEDANETDISSAFLDPAPLPEERVELREEQECLYAAIQTLPPKARADRLAALHRRPSLSRYRTPIAYPGHHCQDYLLPGLYEVALGAHPTAREDQGVLTAKPYYPGGMI